MKSNDNKGVLKLLGKKADSEDAPKTAAMDVSVLAKLAEDVIAWNRPLSETKVTEGARPAQVASLQSLSRGFKIKRTEETPLSESQEGVVRLFNKEK